MNLWQPVSLWDCLEEKSIGNYHWKKEKRDFAKCYVCYFDNKEIGFIPVEYKNDDVEWINWWKNARQRHNGSLCLRDLMNEIMDRHQKRV